MSAQILILFAVAIIQSFMAGYYFCDKIGWQSDFSGKLEVSMTSFAILILGVPLAVLALILASIGAVLFRAWNFFHLGFIFKYVWLKKELEYYPEGINDIHEMAASMNPKWYQLNQYIYKFIDRWLQDKFKSQLESEGIK